MNRKCDHGREKSKCQECGGGSICPHGIVRGTCSSCEPRQVFRRYQTKAASRGLDFKITEQQFIEIVARCCYLCGTYGEPRGLDRVDNHRPYHLSNVEACCGPCNMAKRTDDIFTFLGRIRRILWYQETRKPPQLAAT
jgi:hypothetical protein